jgi:glutathione S-transferase
MSPRFTLHGIWLSGPTYKVGLALALSGEAFDYVHVNLRGGEHKAPGFVQKQRFGQVPLLEDNSNGRNLCQAAAILEYVADVTGKFGGATLDERMQAREWMYWDYDRLAPPIYRSRGIRMGFRSVSQPVAEMYHAEGKLALQVLDDHLKGRDWLVGENVTMADIDIYGVLAYASAGGFRLDDFPSVSAWIQRFEALPGFGSPEQILPRQTTKAP